MGPGPYSGSRAIGVRPKGRRWVKSDRRHRRETITEGRVPDEAHVVRRVAGSGSHRQQGGPR